MSRISPRTKTFSTTTATTTIAGRIVHVTMSKLKALRGSSTKERSFNRYSLRNWATRSATIQNSRSQTINPSSHHTVRCLTKMDAATPPIAANTASRMRAQKEERSIFTISSPHEGHFPVLPHRNVQYSFRTGSCALQHGMVCTCPLPSHLSHASDRAPPRKSTTSRRPRKKFRPRNPSSSILDGKLWQRTGKFRRTAPKARILPTSITGANSTPLAVAICLRSVTIVGSYPKRSATSQLTTDLVAPVSSASRTIVSPEGPHNCVRTIINPSLGSNRKLIE